MEWNIKIDPINQRGKELIEQYRLFHRTYEKARKDDILQQVKGFVRGNKAILSAFMNPREGAFRLELCNHAQFSSDIQIVKELKEPVEQYLGHLGVSNFELYPYRRIGYSKMSTLCVERRIGIKAKDLEVQNELSVADSRAFFKDGHAAAFLSFIVIPILKKELGEECESVRILYSVARTRSYLENIRVQFLTSFSDVTDTSRPLDIIAEKMKQLDQFKAEHPILF